jgi:membrane protease YdiL (CAAX protease family)
MWPSTHAIPIDPLTVWFFAFCGIILPYHALRSAVNRRTGVHKPARGYLVRQVLFFHGILIFLSGLVAMDTKIDIFWAGTLDAKALTYAFGIIVLMLVSIPLRWRFLSDERKRRALHMVPQQPSELGWWLVVSMGAGVAEELTYRGVMFALLFRLTGAWWPAALICALVFAVGHIYHGLAGATIVVLFSLGMQWLVLATGSLYLAMAVHVVYDFLAGIVYVNLAKGLSLTPSTVEQTRKVMHSG